MIRPLWEMARAGREEEVSVLNIWRPATFANVIGLQLFARLASLRWRPVLPAYEYRGQPPDAGSSLQLSALARRLSGAIDSPPDLAGCAPNNPWPLSR